MTHLGIRPFAIPALTLALLMAAHGGGATGSAPPSEPSAPLELGVRLVSLTGHGESQRALVETLVLSQADLSSLRLDHGRRGEPSSRADIEVPGDARRLRAWQARKVQVSLDLAPGIVHHLEFTAEGLDRSGGVVRGAAYLQLNLDPALMPQEVDLEDEGLLQYRAVEGGSQP